MPSVCVPLGDRGYGLRLEYDTVPGTAGLLSSWWVGEKRVLLWIYVKDREGVIWEVEEQTLRSGSRWVASRRSGNAIDDIVARSGYANCDDSSEWACRVNMVASPGLVCVP